MIRVHYSHPSPFHSTEMSTGVVRLDSADTAVKWLKKLIDRRGCPVTIDKIEIVKVDA
jgi:hypothetical protein